MLRIGCTGLFGAALKIGFAQEPAKARYFSLFKAMCTRTFEECTLRADYKRKLSAPVRFDFTHLPDQFNDITPVNVTWKAAVQETFQKQFMFVIEMRVHSSSFPCRNRVDTVNCVRTIRPEVALRLDSKPPCPRPGNSRGLPL